jgi:hypothetical protein
MTKGVQNLNAEGAEVAEKNPLRILCGLSALCVEVFEMRIGL